MKSLWIKNLEFAAPNLSRVILDRNGFKSQQNQKILQQLSNVILKRNNATEKQITDAIAKCPLEVLKNNLRDLEANFSRIQLKSCVSKLIVNDHKNKTIQDNTYNTNHLIKNLLPFFNIKGLRWLFTTKIMIVICTISWMLYKIVMHVLGTHHAILKWALERNANEIVMHMLASQDNIVFLCIGSVLSIVTPRAVKFLRKK